MEIDISRFIQIFILYARDMRYILIYHKNFFLNSFSANCRDRGCDSLFQLSSFICSIFNKWHTAAQFFKIDESTRVYSLGRRDLREGRKSLAAAASDWSPPYRATRRNPFGNVLPNAAERVRERTLSDDWPVSSSYDGHARARDFKLRRSSSKRVRRVSDAVLAR